MLQIKKCLIIYNQGIASIFFFEILVRNLSICLPIISSIICQILIIFLHVSYLDININLINKSIMKSNSQQTSISKLPQRPKLNKSIIKKLRPIKIITNLYKINFRQKNQKFNQFQLEFDPEILANSRLLIKTAVESIEKDLHNKIGFYIQRGTIIWSFKNCDGFLSVKTEFIDKITNQKFQYKIELKKTKELSLKSLEEGMVDSQKIIQVLNSALKKNLGKIGMIEHGKTSKFYFKDEINSHYVNNSDLKVWKGIQTSIHLLKIENKLNNQIEAYLQVDSSSRVQRCSTFLNELKNLNSNQHNDFIGRQVIANYGNHKTYTIESIDKSKTPQSTFQRKGKKISYKEYFKTTYNQIIKQSRQPLIKVQNKNKQSQTEIYLVPQLISLSGMNEEETKDRKLMQSVALHTKLTASQRLEENDKFLKEKFIGETQIYKIEKEPTKVDGYVLFQPMIQLSQQNYPKGGQMNVRTRLLDPMQLNGFIVIATSKSKKDDDQVDELQYLFQQAAPAYGIKIGKPTILIPDDSKFQDFEKVIREDIKKYKKPSFIITFLTDFESKFYGKLKKLLYVQIGVPHQNVLRKTLKVNKNSLSIASKILKQINAKLGKPLWHVIKQHPQFEKKKIAIGGMAIYHKLLNGNQSCEAFVGTIDDNFTSYYSAAKLMPSKTQRLIYIEQTIYEWMKTYFLANKCLPDSIFLYRDGVGHSQITSVINMEFEQIQKALSKAADKIKSKVVPKIAFIIANQKINQRMFVKNQGDRGRDYNKLEAFNPQSGTVVGQPISKFQFDFYLVAQYVQSGTTTPTHYNVIRNSTEFSEDAFWYLTFEQCFNYYNWQGAVRVPAPLMYANKLASMVGQHLKKQPNKEISKMLYYL